MEVETLSLWAKRKGIKLLGTGDFTHPLYLLDLKSKLRPLGNGLLARPEDPDGTHFMLTAEVSNMFTQGGRGKAGAHFDLRSLLRSSRAHQCPVGEIRQDQL